MDGPGDQRLARAALAGNQHRGPRVGHGVDHVEDLQHAAVMADNAFHAEPHVELGLEASCFPRSPSAGSSPVRWRSTALRRSAAWSGSRSAETDGLDRRFDRAIAGNHDHGGGGIVLAAMRQQVKAVAVAEPDVDQQRVGTTCGPRPPGPRPGWPPCRWHSPVRGATRPSKPSTWRSSSTNRSVPSCFMVSYPACSGNAVMKAPIVAAGGGG